MIFITYIVEIWLCLFAFTETVPILLTAGSGHFGELDIELISASGFLSGADITSVNSCNACTEHDPASQRLESLQFITGYTSYVPAETVMPRVIDYAYTETDMPRVIN